MGRFLNKGNGKFAELAASKYFVDKTELIKKSWKKTEQKNLSATAGRAGSGNP